MAVVKIPMMPKGVEHLQPLPTIQLSTIAGGQTANAGGKVKIPMMPKGVEHQRPKLREAAHGSSEDSNDAERR